MLGFSPRAVPDLVFQTRRDAACRLVAAAAHDSQYPRHSRAASAHPAPLMTDWLEPNPTGGLHLADANSSDG